MELPQQNLPYLQSEDYYKRLQNSLNKSHLTDRSQSQLASLQKDCYNLVSVNKNEQLNITKAEDEIKNCLLELVKVKELDGEEGQEKN
mmetsp:Transcript_15219/g.14799  ORF Transcript_15219/g.14799 Transcript_15219/m.14799 type:complete len:88 (-) Transcript_15219:504-767(-)